MARYSRAVKSARRAYIKKNLEYGEERLEAAKALKEANNKFFNKCVLNSVISSRLIPLQIAVSTIEIGLTEALKVYQKDVLYWKRKLARLAK